LWGDKRLKHEDPEARSRHVMQIFEEIAEQSKLIARYLFWIRIWAFVGFGMLIAILLQLDDVIKATKRVQNAVEINAILEKHAED
jgi:hypothetical protein